MHVFWRKQGFPGINIFKSTIPKKFQTLAVRTSGFRTLHSVQTQFPVLHRPVPPPSSFPTLSHSFRSHLLKENTLHCQHLRRSSTMTSTRNADRNGDSRKRKSSPAAPGRPAKLFKPDKMHLAEAMDQNGELSPMPDASYNAPEEAQLVTTARTPADTAEWQATIERVVRNVVSIHFCQTCAFDTDPATSSEATGFVVDAEKGYILTNRHVVGAGPFWGYCIFDNHEEVCKSPLSLCEMANTMAVRCISGLQGSCTRLWYPAIRS